MNVHDAIVKGAVNHHPGNLAWSRNVPNGAEQASVIFDKQKIFSRLLGDMDLVKKVLETFLDESPAMIKGLEKAVRTKKVEDVRGLAHKMAGAAGNVSAFALWEAAKQLEKACGLDDMANLRILKEEVLLQYDILKRVLDWWGILEGS